MKPNTIKFFKTSITMMEDINDRIAKLMRLDEDNFDDMEEAYTCLNRYIEIAQEFVDNN